MAEADFGPAKFVLSKKGKPCLRTDSIVHPNRVYRWVKKVSRPNGSTYFACSHCRSLKEAGQGVGQVSLVSVIILRNLFLSFKRRKFCSQYSSYTRSFRAAVFPSHKKSAGRKVKSADSILPPPLLSCIGAARSTRM